MRNSAFFNFFFISFLKQITYRFDYFIGILNGFLYVFIFTSVWKTLFLSSAMPKQNGFSLSGILSYAVFAMVIRVSFTMDDGVLPMKVRDGSVAIDLIRPVSFFLMRLAESLGYSLFHFVARAIPILIASLFLFDLSMPPAETIYLFIVAAIFGYLILFMVNYIIGLLAFWVIEIFPFLLFKYGLITIFSGGIIPIDFFPEKIKPLLLLIPFPYIFYAPTVILTGHVTQGTAQELIFGQIIWIIVLYFMCKIVWQVGRNKLLIQGG